MIIVKALLPADASRDDTKRFVADLILLVKHKEVGWSSFSLECFLAMIDGPLEFLSGHKDLSKDGIDAGLATVEAGCTNNCVLVVEQEPEKSMTDI